MELFELRYGLLAAGLVLAACASNPDAEPQESRSAPLVQPDRELPFVGQCSNSFGTIKLYASDTEQYAIATGKTENPHYVGLAARTCAGGDYCNQAVLFDRTLTARTKNWPTDSTDIFRGSAFVKDYCPNRSCQDRGLDIRQWRRDGRVECLAMPQPPGSQKTFPPDP